jgi:two-component system response regulator FixJ
MDTGMNDPQPLVLVVDDDESVRRSLQMLLSTAGYSVNTYGSGTDALEHVDTESPACLLLDVSMPDMTGLEVKEGAARARARHRHCFHHGLR